jgi:hypothetical protein
MTGMARFLSVYPSKPATQFQLLPCIEQVAIKHPAAEKKAHDLCPAGQVEKKHVAACRSVRIALNCMRYLF